MDEAFLKQAKSRAAKYCVLRERAPQQVLEKLISWDLSQEQAQEVVDILTKEQFLDESRFCRAFCHDKFEFNQWGRNRIRLELMKFNLPEKVVFEGLSYIDSGRYEAVLKKLAMKKWESAAGEPQAWVRQRKTADYLLRKGFETDLVWEAVKRLSGKKH